MTLNRDPEFLQEFSAEAFEHLGAIEHLLGTDNEGADINTLFRSFHSLKGLGRIAGLHGVESLAHEVETLLSAVRAGTQPLTEGLRALLLRATDVLQEQCAGYVGANPVAAPPDELLQQLRAALPQGAAASTAAPQAPAKGAETPLVAWLGVDRDDLIGLVELIEEIAGPDGSNWQALDAGLLREDADTLSFAGDRLRLPGLASCAASLGEAAARNDEAGIGAGLSALARIARNLRQALHTPDPPAPTEGPAWLADAAAAIHDRWLEDGSDAWLRGLSDLGLLRPDAGFQLERAIPADPWDIWNPDPAAVMVALGNAPIDDELVPDTLEFSQRTSVATERWLGDCGIAAEHLERASPITMQVLDEMRSQGMPTLVELNIGIGAGTVDWQVLTAFRVDWLPLLALRLPQQDGQALAWLVASSVQDPAIEAKRLLAGSGLEVASVARPDPKQPAALFGKSHGPSAPVAETHMRVPIKVMDDLFARVGEFFSVATSLNVLVFDSGIGDALRRIADHVSSGAPAAVVQDVQLLMRQMQDLADLESDVSRLGSQIHESMLNVRVVPLDNLVTRFGRMIRSTAEGAGKKVRFDADTGGIRVDKGMVELLADPLMHILRNAVDHGIELPEERAAAGKPAVGLLRLAASQHANRIVIEVRDDGRGIPVERVRAKAVAAGLLTPEAAAAMPDEEAVRMIFAPGLSTAESVTETSGRGVGMDVAMVNVSRIGGLINVSTAAGQGSCFTLEMPLSAAIQSVLLTDAGGQIIAVPERMVSEIILRMPQEIQRVNGQPATLLHGRYLPLFNLGELLHLPNLDTTLRVPAPIVVCELDGQRIGLVVQRTLRMHDMLIRDTHPRVVAMPGIGGVSTLGAGRIVLVIEPEKIIHLARQASTTGLRTSPDKLAGGDEGKAAA